MVISGKRLRSCATWTIPCSRSCAGERRVASSPAKTMRPFRARSSPLSTFSTVDLPAPFGPTRQVTVPSSSSSVRSRRMSPRPYPATTPSRRRRGSAAEVGIQDAWVASHLVRVPFGELRALREHHDGVAQPHDEVHVVLDDEERQPACVELSDPLLDLLDEHG